MVEIFLQRINMSEETVVPTDTQTDSVETVIEAQATETETDWKAMARKWESRAKAAKADTEDAQRWREYLETQKTEQERVNDELARAKAEAEAAKLELMRIQVASAKGISSEAARLLRGSTVEEIEAEAELLVSLMASSKNPTQPQPDASQGRPAPTTAGQVTREQLTSMSPADIMKAKAEGRLTELLGR